MAGRLEEEEMTKEADDGNQSKPNKEIKWRKKKERIHEFRKSIRRIHTVAGTENYLTPHAINEFN